MFHRVNVKQDLLMEFLMQSNLGKRRMEIQALERGMVFRLDAAVGNLVHQLETFGLELRCLDRPNIGQVVIVCSHSTVSVS